MLVAQFEPTVQAFIEFFLECLMTPGCDTEEFEPGYLQDQMRIATGFPDLEIDDQAGHLVIHCSVICQNPNCSAYHSAMAGHVEYHDVPVPVDGLYRIICKCGTLPNVVGIFDDGELEMNVGGIGPGGATNV